MKHLSRHTTPRMLRRVTRRFAQQPTQALALFVGVFAVVGTYLLVASKAATPVATIESESGVIKSPATVISDNLASAGQAVQFKAVTAPPPASAYPDVTNRPHMISATVMAYKDGNGVAQQVTLKPIPAGGVTFGTGGCAYHDPRGWVTVTGTTPCVIDGYDFGGNGLVFYGASHVTIQRCRFRTTGYSNFAIKLGEDNVPEHYGSDVTIQDNLFQGDDTSINGAMDTGVWYSANTSHPIVVTRNTFENIAAAMQSVRLEGDGTVTNNQFTENWIHAPVIDPNAVNYHTEPGGQWRGTGGLLIQHNSIEGPNGQTATIMIDHDSDSVKNITISDNLLLGSPNNTIYGGDTGGSGGTYLGNVKVLNNKFSTSNRGNLLIDWGGKAGDQASGNIWYETGAAIPGL